MTTPNLTPEHRSRLAALAFLLDKREDRYREWRDVRRKIIGRAPLGSPNLLQGIHHDVFDWLVGPWGDVDPTPSGAAARIRYLLSHGLPEDWREQMSGEAKLCYNTQPVEQS